MALRGWLEAACEVAPQLPDLTALEFRTSFTDKKLRAGASRTFASDNRHNFVRNVEVGVDFLSVVVLFEGVDEPEGLLRGPHVEVHAVLGLHGDLRVLERSPGLFEALAHRREVFGRRHRP